MSPVGLQLDGILDDAETINEILQRDPDEICPGRGLRRLVSILRRLAALDLPPDDSGSA